MDTLFDLPAHIFFVHLPVVAAPTAAVAAVVVMARQNWESRYGAWPLGISVVAFGAILLAYSSGEEFAKRFEGLIDISRHQDLASTLRIMSGLHVLVVGAMFVLARRQSDARTPARWVTSGVALVLSVLVLIWTIRTGHEGAKVTWSGVV